MIILIRMLQKYLKLLICITIIITIEFPPYNNNNVFCSVQNSNIEWFNSARISGGDFWEDMTEEEIKEKVKDLITQNVNVLELDIGLIHLYETFFEPEIYIEETRQIVQIAHEEGLAVVEYIAGFELITKDVSKKDHSVLKDHPEWLQQDLFGNYAVYGSELGFWINDDDESAWVTPLAPDWRTQYMTIIADLAETGVDGIYIDVPYWQVWFNDDNEYTWSSFDDYTVSEFVYRYGHLPPQDDSEFTLSNPTFIKWLQFRIDIINEFFEEVTLIAKGINPDIKIIAELWLAQGIQALFSGADPYYLYNYVDAITHEFSIDDDSKAMTEDLWLYTVIKNMIYRALDYDHPSWILDYSVNPIDSTALAAANIMFECNFWETDGPEMSGTVGLDYRQELFQWIKNNDQFLYGNWDVLDPVAVYFSPQTRNFVYSLNATLNPILESGAEYDDQFWESYSEFIGGHHSYELYGITALLLQSHIPTKIITSRHLKNLNETDCRLLVLPDVAALNETEIALINDFAKNKPVLATGLTSLYFHNGTKRSDFGLGALYNSSYYNEQSQTTFNNCTFLTNRIGEDFWFNLMYGERNSANEKRDNFVNILQTVDFQSWLSTNASSATLMNPYTNGTDIIFRIANFKGTKRNHQYPDSVSLSISLTDNKFKEYNTLAPITISFGGILYFDGQELILYNELIFDFRINLKLIIGLAITIPSILILSSVITYIIKRKKRLK